MKPFATRKITILEVKFKPDTYEDVLRVGCKDEEGMYVMFAFKCAYPQDMYNFSKLLEYTEARTLKEMIGKQFTGILEGRIYCGLGHLTDDKFLPCSDTLKQMRNNQYRGERTLYTEDSLRETMINIMAIRK